MKSKILIFALAMAILSQLFVEMVPASENGSDVNVGTYVDNERPSISTNNDPCEGVFRERWIPIPACGTWGESPAYIPGLHYCGYQWDNSEQRCVEKCFWQGQCSMDPY